MDGERTKKSNKEDDHDDERKKKERLDSTKKKKNGGGGDDEDDQKDDDDDEDEDDDDDDEMKKKKLRCSLAYDVDLLRLSSFFSFSTLRAHDENATDKSLALSHAVRKKRSLLFLLLFLCPSLVHSYSPLLPHPPSLRYPS